SRGYGGRSEGLHETLDENGQTATCAQYGTIGIHLQRKRKGTAAHNQSRQSEVVEVTVTQQLFYSRARLIRLSRVATQARLRYQANVSAIKPALTRCAQRRSGERYGRARPGETRR